MTEALQNMRAKRVFDAAELHDFASLGGRQTYGRAENLPAIPAGFLVPYLRQGRWLITGGYVEGVKFTSSDAPLNGLAAGSKVVAVVDVSRETLTNPTEVEGEVFVYPTGRYIIEAAEIRILDAEIPLPDEVTNTRALTSKLLFTCDADGNPPGPPSGITPGSPHFRIDGATLTF